MKANSKHIYHYVMIQKVIQGTLLNEKQENKNLYMFHHHLLFSKEMYGLIGICRCNQDWLTLKRGNIETNETFVFYFTISEVFKNSQRIYYWFDSFL